MQIFIPDVVSLKQVVLNIDLRSNSLFLFCIYNVFEFNEEICM